MSATEEMLQAAEGGDLERVRRLLTSDPGLVNAKGEFDKTPLHWAAEKDHAAVAELLASKGADIRAEVSWGMTPLQWAANMGSRDTAEVLLRHGAELNMWSAAGLGMLEAVQSFWESPNTLKKGAGQPGSREVSTGKFEKVPASEDYQHNVSDAFYIACRNGHTHVARFLLEKGADIDFRGFFGAPGLHWAAINGHRRTVEFLLEKGADIRVRDHKFNSTPAGWAREGKHMEIESLLHQRGSQ